MKGEKGAQKVWVIFNSVCWLLCAPTFAHLWVELRFGVIFFVVESERFIDQAWYGGVCGWEISAVAP